MGCSPWGRKESGMIEQLTHLNMVKMYIKTGFCVNVKQVCIFYPIFGIMEM